VFAERAGVYSAALSSEYPAANLFEIQNVQSSPANGYVEITWEQNPDGAAAVVLKQNDKGEWEKMAEGSFNSYIERNLINDITYVYNIRYVYTASGIRLETPGITVKAVPVSPSQPVSYLDIRRVSGDNFVAEWTNPNPAGTDIILYVSLNKPELKYGEVVNRTRINNELTQLSCVATGGGTAEFVYSDADMFYVTAVAFKSGLYVIGPINCAGKLDPPVIKSVANISGEIHVFINNIENAAEFQVLYGSENFPLNTSDEGITVRNIPYKQYAYDFSLNIGIAEARIYYICVRAKYISVTGEELYSEVSKTIFRNEPKKTITYTIGKVKNGKLPLVFECERPLNMPPIEIYAAAGHPPMFKKSELFLAEIPGTTIRGSYSCSIDVSKKLPKDTHIRIFLKDESHNEDFKLKIAVNSITKIN
jgi:hypothetical protein